MKFSKNASLNLSINAIVILILAITMLGLGLGFMRNIFGGATEQFEEMTGTVYKQMIEDMKASNEIVQINRPKIDLSIGETGQVFIGWKNVATAEKNLKITAADCAKLGSDTCEAGKIYSEYKTGDIKVRKGEIGIVPLNIVTTSTAEEGTYFFDITVAGGGTNYYIELVVDVTI